MQCRLVLLAVLVVACSSPASHPQANASVARTSAQPQPSPGATPAAAVATCRLPVVSWYQPGNPVQLPSIGVQGHFVSYPDGTVSAHPQGEFTNGEDGFGWRSSATPALRGTGRVGYYDVAFKRFLPVPHAQVSPDGARYVYMVYTQGGLYAYGQIHVVDVATGHDRTFDLPAAQYLIFDFRAEGIYFTYGPYGQSAGLSLLDPNSGKARQVLRDGYVLAVTDGKAWVAVNEQDLDPTSPLPGGEGNATFPVLKMIYLRGKVGELSWTDLEKRTQTMIRIGRRIGPASRQVMGRWAAKPSDWFHEFDIALMPCVAKPSIPAGGWTGRGFVSTALDQIRALPYAAPWNVAGFPAASIPAGKGSDGVPLSVQIVAPTNGEAMILALALQLERMRPWERLPVT